MIYIILQRTHLVAEWAEKKLEGATAKVSMESHL
jgi:hypothetical protein